MKLNMKTKNLSQTFWSRTEGPTINNTFFPHGYYAVRGPVATQLVRIENSIGEVVETRHDMSDASLEAMVALAKSRAERE